MTNEYNPDGKEIRFIDSHYKDLFHIPDGSCVQIHYPDEMVVKPCTFIDEYHTQIGYNVFHICQFAEIMERNGASYMPEPEIMGDEAAWKVGKDRILAVQTCEDGYDYTLLDENYNEIDGGQVDNPELSMLEVRRDILESFGLERRELRAMFYEDVMEQAFEVGRQAVVVNDPIAELAFKLDRFAENFDPYEYMDQVDDVQAHIQEIKADLAAGNTAPYREFLNSAKEKMDFLKHEYGTGGHSHACSGATHSGQDHDAKGVAYTKSGCDKLQMSWAQVVQRIDGLIRKGRYLSPEEEAERQAIEEAKTDPLEDVYDRFAVIDTEDGEYLLHAVFDCYLQSACRADVPDNDCRMDVRHQRRSRNAPTAGSCLCGLYHPSHCGMADY